LFSKEITTVQPGIVHCVPLFFIDVSIGPSYYHHKITLINI